MTLFNGVLNTRTHDLSFINYSDVWLIALAVDIVSLSGQNVFNNHSQNLKPETWKKKVLF